MTADGPRGRIYHCPVCGAEIVCLSHRMGGFHPICCNVDMVPLERRAAFYVCPVCNAEVAVTHSGNGEFHPRCCNTDMHAAA